MFVRVSLACLCGTLFVKVFVKVFVDAFLKVFAKVFVSSARRAQIVPLPRPLDIIGGMTWRPGAPSLVEHTTPGDCFVTSWRYRIQGWWRAHVFDEWTARIRTTLVDY